MPTDNTTSHLGLQLPHPDNELSYDVLRLINALTTLDGYASDNDDALGDKADSTAALDALAALTPVADRIPYFSGSNTAAMAVISAWVRLNILTAADAAAVRTALSLAAVATTGAYSDLSGKPAIPEVVTDENDTTSARVVNVDYIAKRGLVATLDLSAFAPAPSALVNKGVFVGYTTASALGISADTTRGAIMYFAASSTAVGIYRKFFIGLKTYTQFAVDGSTWSAWSLSENFTAPTRQFQSLGSVSGSRTVDLNLGTYVKLTQTGNLILEFTLPADHGSTSVTEVTMDISRTGSHTLTLPAGSRWDEGSTPTLSTANIDTLVFTKTGTDNWLVKRVRRNI